MTLPQLWQKEVREKETGILLMSVFPQQRRKKPVGCKREHLEADTVSRKLSGPKATQGKGVWKCEAAVEGTGMWLRLQVLAWQRGD